MNKKKSKVGRPRKWQSEKIKLIRVPETIADELLEIAKVFDQGVAPRKSKPSGHGGASDGAGRKSQWASGCKFVDTKAIRVPKAIAAQVLAYAHRLDAERSDPDG